MVAPWLLEVIMYVEQKISTIICAIVPLDSRIEWFGVNYIFNFLPLQFVEACCNHEIIKHSSVWYMFDSLAKKNECLHIVWTNIPALELGGSNWRARIPWRTILTSPMSAGTMVIPCFWWNWLSNLQPSSDELKRGRSDYWEEKTWNSCFTKYITLYNGKMWKVCPLLM